MTAAPNKAWQISVNRAECDLDSLTIDEPLFQIRAKPNGRIIIEQRTGLVFAESQRSAVVLALTSKVLVITGGPGVGKTTLVNAILRTRTLMPVWDSSG